MSDPTTPLADFSGALADLVAATAPSVVEVASHRSLASGFVWRDKLIVTADETLAEEGTIEIELSDGSVHPATLVGRDPTTDIALLRVESITTAPVSFAKTTARPGSLVLAVGAANSVPLVAFGPVAAVEGRWRSMRGGDISARIDLGLRLRSRGQGGLAVGANGDVIGMTVQGPRGRPLVIPGETIDRVATLLLEHGRIPRGYLGIGLREVSTGDGEVGGMIMAIDEQGPARTAGLHQGDVITTWAGRPVGSVVRMLRSLGPASIGTSVALTVRRGGVAVEASIVIGDRPAA